MEAFSFLRYWRGGGTTIVGGGNACVNPPSATATSGRSTTNAAAVDMESRGDDDDGPFFDLEIPVPDEDETEENVERNGGDNVEGEESEDQNNNVGAKSDYGCSDDVSEFDFALSSSSSDDRSDPNLILSPSGDLFFKGRLVSIEPNSCLDSKRPQFPVSLLKSATKFRVFLLRFKKSKLNSVEKTESGSANGSVFSPTYTPEKQETTQEDVMRKYLNKVKPLYVRVSRRYSEKLKFSGQLSFGSLNQATPPCTAVSEKGQVEMEVGGHQVNGRNIKQMIIPARLRVVCKHLGKSRSASSAVSAVLSNRRDDSQLQQEDGIQSAILHCKRSLNSSSRGISAKAHHFN